MDEPTVPTASAPPYAFVSYSHQNEGLVLEDLTEISNAGLAVWFDSGINAGARWRTELAEAIDAASFVIFYISSDSVVSSHCLQELHYAADQDLPILPVFLEDAELPASIRLILAERQAIYRSRLSTADYRLTLRNAFERFFNSDARPSQTRSLPEAEGFRKNRIHLSVPLEPESNASNRALVQDVIQYLSWQGGVFRPHSPSPSRLGRGHIDYELLIDLVEVSTSVQVRFSVVEAATNEIIWTSQRDQPREQFHQVSRHLAEVLGEGAIRKISSHEVKESTSTPVDELGYAQLILRADQLNYLDYEETKLRFSLLARAIELEPDCGIAYASLANLQSWKLLNQGKQENEDAVLDAVRMALRRDPDDPIVLLSTGTTLCRLGAYERGLALLRRAHRMAPTVRAKSDLARGLCFAGEPEEAVELFEDILETMPVGQTFPYARLAVALTQAGRLDQALMQSQAATTHFPDDYYGWIIHSNLLGQLGQEAAARDALAEAMDCAPKLDLERVIERTKATYARTEDQVRWLTNGLRRLL